MPTIQQLVNFLSTNGHIGRNNTITARDLAVHYAISDSGVEVQMRDIIRVAIAQGELIGSNNTGFYLIRDIGELNTNLDSLRGRADGILERRRNMLNSWNAQNPNNPTSLPDIELCDI